MRLRLNRRAFATVLAKAVVAQAVLSVGNLGVSLILLRYGSDVQYGYYLLTFNGLSLLTALHSSFVGPAMVLELTKLETVDRSHLIGGLYAGQRRWLPLVAVLCSTGLGALWIAGIMDGFVTLLCGIAVLAAWAALYRQFFRMVLTAYRLSEAVLLGDTVYVVPLVIGAGLAISTPYPALVTIGFLGVGSLASGLVQSRSLWRYEPWTVGGSATIWRRIALIGAWTAAGSVIHWSFSQGYNYLIVGTLNVAAVAAAGSTRMLMMPVNLLSTAIGPMMLPTATGWLKEHGSGGALWRVVLGTSAIAGAALLYLCLLWLSRDFIFIHVIHKHFAQRDLLLILWSVASLLMVARDQLVNFLLARTRFRSLTMLSLGCAIVSLTVSYLAILRIGVAGGPVGVLTGEVVNVAGLMVLSRREVRLSALQRAI